MAITLYFSEAFEGTKIRKIKKSGLAPLYADIAVLNHFSKITTKGAQLKYIVSNAATLMFDVAF